MSDAKQKIKKLTPLWRMKKRELDLATMELKIMEQELTKLNIDLNKIQGLYLQKAEELNDRRSMIDRHGIAICELEVDYYKANWVKIFKDKIQCEQRLAAKRIEVIKIDAKTQTIDKLIGKHRKEHLIFLDKKEQEFLDEISARMHYLNK